MRGGTNHTLHGAGMLRTLLCTYHLPSNGVRFGTTPPAERGTRLEHSLHDELHPPRMQDTMAMDTRTMATH